MKVLILKYRKDWIIAMGDVIDCVPLLNWLSKKELFMLPCLNHHVENFKTFFGKNDNIVFMPLYGFDMIDEAKQKYGSIDIIGDNPADTPEYYSDSDMKWVYKAAGLDYADRFQYDTIPSQAKTVPQIQPFTEPYAVVTELGSNGIYPIDRKYIGKGLLTIEPPKDSLMLSYAKIIENATEIHCAASAYSRLVDKLPTNGKLYMHHYARQTGHKPEKWKEYGILTKAWNQIM